MLENEVMNEEVEATEMDNEVEDSKVEEPQNEQESVHLINKGEAAAFALGAAAAGVALWEGGKKAVHWIGHKIDPDGSKAKVRAEKKQAKLEAKLAKKKAKAEAAAQQVENKTESTEEK